MGTENLGSERRGVGVERGESEGGWGGQRGKRSNSVRTRELEGERRILPVPVSQGDTGTGKSGRQMVMARSPGN